MSGSSNVGGSRPILPAPSPHQDKRGSWDKGGATATQKQKNVPKRTQITAVACQPCQQRKSKCDGARPICSACIAKKRMDCAYDTAGDQRRTAALKQRIKELEKQIHDVKEMVRTICSAVDKNVAISIAQTLHMEDFRNVEEVRNLLKSQKSKEMAGLPENFGVQSQIVGEPPGVLVGSHPQSDQVMPSQYDPALINGLSVFEHMSSSWVPGVSGLPSADGTAVDAQWHYDHSPVDATDLPWQSPNAYMMNPASAIHGYDTPHGFPTLSKTKSRPHSIDGVSGREIDGDDSQMPSEAGQSRYWYRPGKGVTHLQLFTSLAAPPGSGKNSIIDSAPVPLHALQPLNEADENPLSQKAATFIAQKRRLIGEGWPIDQVLGSEDIDSSVLRPKEIRKTPSTELTVCQWVVHMFEGMKEVKVPEKVAMTLLCVMFFRWSIFPSVEHYQRIPEWMRPTPTQTITPHAVWIDFIPWPEIRDAFINSPELAETPDAFEMLVINASVNWPWPLNEVISLRSNVDGVQLNKTFEQYVRDINNWSLSPVIVAVFPVLGDKAWIRPEKEDDEYLLDADSQEAVFGFQ